MNINKNIINHSVTGARLSYVDKNNETNEDENDFNHVENQANSYNNYNHYYDHSKLSYIKASDSIKANCVGKEITILDKNGNTNLNKLYINGSDGFIANLDLLTAILSNSLTEQNAKDICRKIGSVIDAASNY